MNRHFLGFSVDIVLLCSSEVSDEAEVKSYQKRFKNRGLEEAPNAVLKATLADAYILCFRV